MLLRTIVSLTFFLTLIAPTGAAEIRFEKIVLDTTFRSEGVATGDINHDATVDVTDLMMLLAAWGPCWGEDGGR